MKSKRKSNIIDEESEIDESLDMNKEIIKKIKIDEISVLSPEDTSNSEEDDDENEPSLKGDKEYLACINCNKNIKLKDKFCGHCGKRNDQNPQAKHNNIRNIVELESRNNEIMGIIHGTSEYNSKNFDYNNNNSYSFNDIYNHNPVFKNASLQSDPYQGKLYMLLRISKNSKGKFNYKNTEIIFASKTLALYLGYNLEDIVNQTIEKISSLDIIRSEHYEMHIDQIQSIFDTHGDNISLSYESVFSHFNGDLIGANIESASMSCVKGIEYCFFCFFTKYWELENIDEALHIMKNSKVTIN